MQKGYIITKIFEVYHWNETTQLDKLTANGGLFSEYMKLFLRMKQEASRQPEWVQSEEDMVRYIEMYAKHEGIVLEKDNIKRNMALRSIAKLYMVSLWGKFGQCWNLPHPKILP